MWNDLSPEAIRAGREARYAANPSARAMDRQHEDPGVGPVADAARILGGELPAEYAVVARLRLVYPCMSDNGLAHIARQDDPAIRPETFKARLRRLIEFGRQERDQLDHNHNHARSPTAAPRHRGLGARLTAGNTLRTAQAAARTVAQARAVLEAQGESLPAKHVEVARLRIEHPDATLAELAAMAGVSKDVYAGRLRRLLALV